MDRGLDGLLRDTLAVDDLLDFESLKEAAPRPPFALGALGVPEPPPDPARFRPPAPGAAQKLVPGVRQRYEARFEAGRRQYDAAVQEHQQREAERLRRLEQARSEHQRAIAAVEERLARQHAEVEASFDFAKDKPLELLSGSHLLYLLKVHADVDAKIEPPEHWAEPRSDSGPAHWDEPHEP